MDLASEGTTTSSRRSSPLEVLRIFLKLGPTCFGGPIESLLPENGEKPFAVLTRKVIKA